MKHYFSDILIILFMFMLINATHTYFHESIDADICENFGGTANVEYSFLMQGGKTQCTTTDGAIYHTINDIVSYTTSILILTIFACLIFLTLFFEKRYSSYANKKRLSTANERILKTHVK